MNANDPTVLIVGAGPTGLTAAACLARSGVRVRLIDKAVKPPDDRSRAVLLQARTLELFDDLGIVAETYAAGVTVTAANLFSPSGRRGSIRFAGSGLLDSPYADIVTLPQDETERILGELVTRLGVGIERGVELTSLTDTSDGAKVSLLHADGRVEQLDVGWVIGCDGAHSTVRGAGGMTFEGVTYPDECMLGDVVIDWMMPEGEVSICPHREGILLVFPLTGQRHFRIIMILPREGAGESRDLGIDEFRAQLERMTPDGMGSRGGPPAIEQSNWLTRYRLHRRGVDTYQRGHVFVAGDAAHIHSPVGAQGMNTGIQDAYNLAWKLALVSRGEAPVSLLATYNSERQRIGELLLHGTDRMFALLAGRGMFSRILRRLLPGLAVRILGAPFVRARAAHFVSELGIKYRRSALSVNAPGSATLATDTPQAGDRAPDAPVRTADGADRRLFDEFRGPHHTLLLFGGDTSNMTWANEIATRMRNERGSTVTVATVVQNPASDARALVDAGSAAHRKYGAMHGAIYLVRPDGYIAFRGAPSDAAALFDDLRTRFIQQAPVAAGYSEASWPERK